MLLVQHPSIFLPKFWTSFSHPPRTLLSIIFFFFLLVDVGDDGLVKRGRQQDKLRVLRVHVLDDLVQLGEKVLAHLVGLVNDHHAHLVQRKLPVPLHAAHVLRQRACMVRLKQTEKERKKKERKKKKKKRKKERRRR